MKNLSLGEKVHYQMFCCSLTTIYNQDQDAFNESQAAVMTLVPFVLTATASVQQICTFTLKSGSVSSLLLENGVPTSGRADLKLIGV